MDQDITKKVGRRLAHLPGVGSVYFVLGDMDFVVLIRAKNRQDYVQKLDSIINMAGIESD